MAKLNLCSWFTELFRCSSDRRDVYVIPDIYDTPPMFNNEQPSSSIVDCEPAKVAKAKTSRKPRAPTKQVRRYIQNVPEMNEPARFDHELTDFGTDSRKLKPISFHPRTHIYDTIAEASPIASKKKQGNHKGRERLRLPIKAITVEPTVSATEVELHDRVPKIVKLIEKPDCSAVLQQISDLTEILDPEYRQILRLHNANSDPSTESNATGTIPKPVTKRHYFTDLEALQPYAAPDMLLPKDEVQFVLHESDWYQTLTATHKMLVDHQLSIVSYELNRFHKNSAADKRLDLTFVMQNVKLQQVLSNLGFYVSGGGMLEQIPQMLRATGCAKHQEEGVKQKRPHLALPHQDNPRGAHVFH